MSFTKTGTWVDPQGTSHTDAVFEVAYASTHNNTATMYTYDSTNGFSGTTGTTNTDVQRHVNYRMYYWTNQASRDAGNLPYVLASLDPVGEIHNGNNLDVSYDGLTPVEAAEKHCQEVVLV